MMEPGSGSDGPRLCSGPSIIEKMVACSPMLSKLSGESARGIRPCGRRCGVHGRRALVRGGLEGGRSGRKKKAWLELLLWAASRWRRAEERTVQWRGRRMCDGLAI